MFYRSKFCGRELQSGQISRNRFTHNQKRIFIHKLSIAQKEASETNYWLIILRDSDFIKPELAESLLADCEEVQKILTSSIKPAKSNLDK